MIISSTTNVLFVGDARYLQNSTVRYRYLLNINNVKLDFSPTVAPLEKVALKHCQDPKIHIRNTVLTCIMYSITVIPNTTLSQSLTRRAGESMGARPVARRRGPHSSCRTPPPPPPPTPSRWDSTSPSSPTTQEH